MVNYYKKYFQMNRNEIDPKQMCYDLVCREFMSYNDFNNVYTELDEMYEEFVEDHQKESILENASTIDLDGKLEIDLPKMYAFKTFKFEKVLKQFKEDAPESRLIFIHAIFKCILTMRIKSINQELEERYNKLTSQKFENTTQHRRMIEEGNNFRKEYELEILHLKTCFELVEEYC